MSARSRVLKLLLLQINAKFGRATTAHAGKYAWIVLRYLLIVAAAVTLFYAGLTYLIRLGMQSNLFLLSLVLLATQIISTVFAVTSILSNLYFNKDNQLLLVLPVSANEVFVSKLLMVYVTEFLINTMFTFPVLVIVGFYARLGWQFYTILPFSMVVLPLVPIALAALISVPVSLLVTFLKRHNNLTIIIVLLLVGAGLYGYVMLMGSINSSFNIAADQIKIIISINGAVRKYGGYNRPYLDIATALTGFKYFWIMLLYIVAGGGLVAVSVLVIKPVYFHSIMKLAESGKPPRVRTGSFKKQSGFVSLIGKEFKDIFRSASYVFQYFLFTLLMPVIVYCYDKLLLQLVVNDVGQMMIAGSHVLIMAVVAMLSNLVSATSVSREGANFYLMKTVPVSYYTQSAAKVCFNAMFTVGAVLLTAGISSFYLAPTPVWLGAVAVIVASLAHIILSFDMDLKNPTLDWYDDSDITKMSKNSAKSLGLGMVIALVLGAVVIGFANRPVLGMGIALVISCGLFLYALYVGLIRVYYKFHELEV